MSKVTEYPEKFKDPRWQKKRLEVMERDEWKCQKCGDKDNTLNVHHRYYENGKDPWDYPLEALITLCQDCHKYEKDNFKGLESDIRQDMRKKFMSDDLVSIAHGFAQAKFTVSPSMLSSLLCLVMVNPNVQQLMYNMLKYGDGTYMDGRIEGIEGETTNE